MSQKIDPGMVNGGIFSAGDLKMSARTSPEEGWFLCNGAELSRVDYASLFNAIGVAFGDGDGIDTFNIPDFQDRMPMIAGATYPLGTKGGAATVALTQNNLPAHTHNLGEASDFADGGTKAGVIAVGGGDATETSSTGNTEPFSILPPYAGINVFIKA